MKILDRITLSRLLPTKWSYTDMATIKDMRGKLDISKKEMELVSMTENKDTGYLKWDSKKDPDKDMKFSAAEKGIIKRSLKDLDKKKEIEDAHINLYDTFC